MSKTDNVPKSRRRDFLARVSGAVAAGSVASVDWLSARGRAAPGRLPTVRLGTHEITRLIAGGNPIGGHSHTTAAMGRLMREYFTLERTVQFLLDCEAKGINTWQYSPDEKALQALEQARNQGSKINFISLHAARPTDPPLKDFVKRSRPLAVVHHGGATDSLFRGGKSSQVHDFVKRVHDLGVMAGVSAHNPDVIKKVADEGWEVDLFMCCFYHVSRSREEQQQLMGQVTVGEPFLESDPGRMTDVIKQVSKPCLGFKILAAGRLCNSRNSVEDAFRFAYRNIKPTDAIIVGLFPVHGDEIWEDVELAIRYAVS